MILFIVELFTNDQCFGFYMKPSAGHFGRLMTRSVYEKTLKVTHTYTHTHTHTHTHSRVCVCVRAHALYIIEKNKPFQIKDFVTF